MENVTIKDVVFDKKADNYRFNSNDYVATSEITVTITLAEYRELVTAKAIADRKIEEANADRYERNSENDALKADNSSLKAELYEIRKKLEAKNIINEEKEEPIFGESEEN